MLVESRDFYIWVEVIADYSDFIPFFLLASLKKRKTCYNLLLANFAIISVVKVITNIMADNGIPNLPLYHLMSVVELVFLTLFYAEILNFKKKVTLAILIPFLAFNIISSLFLQEINEWNSYSQTLNNLLFMYFGLHFYYHLYKKEETADVFRSPLFLINTSFLFYFSSTFFLFAMGEYFFTADRTGTTFFDNTWIVSSISNFIKNIIMCVGLVILKRNYNG